MSPYIHVQPFPEHLWPCRCVPCAQHAPQ
jgi:hypothetical protein